MKTAERLKRIENRTYIRETVVLDGHEFVNCKFHDCVLVYSGGQLNWHDTVFVGSTGFDLRDAAARTSQLLSTFGVHPWPDASGSTQSENAAPTESIQ